MGRATERQKRGMECRKAGPDHGKAAMLKLAENGGKAPHELRH